ncbi:GH92 family glycosyl hydrolase [Brevundimonas sp. M20]|uniref:GH92 family glycosyl hydrolase n=1 Tax=Brevundimonas sp. M20 TaxID=2591463 RepID=UPI00143DDD01|nr:GH92 family glycosyl hydrolase [Brevundimonas sp. M20]
MGWRNAVRFGQAMAAAVVLLGLAQPVTAASVRNDRTLPQTVNTFIGTRDEGNTFPGASAPFGLIQVSPIGSHYAGYRYDDETIRGFGRSFISGAGCWEQGGQVSVLPVTGSITPGGTFDTTKANSFDHKAYASRYTHEGEVGQAGYYRVRLTDYGGIDVEATALTRAAAERYTFAPGQTQGHVLINVSQANERHRVIGSQIRVVGDRAVEGKVTTMSFCGGHQYSTWFRIEFDRPFTGFGVWGQAGGTPGARFSMESEHDPRNGAWVTFDLAGGQAVTAISAISHVDQAGARGNLDAEGRRDGQLLSFDAMREAAQEVWNRELRSVRVSGGTRDDRAVFYTALYHALLQPMTGSDADGRYRGYDDQIHVADGWTYHEYFSLWDTYRSQNQLLAILKPERARDIARSVLAIGEQGGWLPRWGYASFETNVMTGDPVTPFMVDLWRYGALEGREQQAWAALRRNAFGNPPLNSRHDGRAGNPHYLAEGYIQFDRAHPSKGMDSDPHHAGSATMEYALGDCSLSIMGAALGQTADAAILRRRGGNWRNVWDASVADGESDFTGFPRPRMEDGEWFTPPAGAYDPTSHYGFHEGTAWQYQWLVPQDVAGLTEAMGGRERTLARLDRFFAFDKISADPTSARAEWVAGPYAYYGQHRYNPNNEPTMHTPWIYTLLGRPDRTAAVVRAAQTLFTNAPNGVTGNDDLGTMSAWYLFGAVGLYPGMPGTGELLVGTPRFEQVEIDLGQGRTLSINAPGATGERVQYVSGARLNGQAFDRVWLDWDQLKAGGRIDLRLTDRADRAHWGQGAGATPQDVCRAR